MADSNIQAPQQEAATPAPQDPELCAHRRAMSTMPSDSTSPDEDDSTAHSPSPDQESETDYTLSDLFRLAPGKAAPVNHGHLSAKHALLRPAPLHKPRKHTNQEILDKCNEVRAYRESIQPRPAPREVHAEDGQICNVARRLEPEPEEQSEEELVRRVERAEALQRVSVWREEVNRELRRHGAILMREWAERGLGAEW